MKSLTLTAHCSRSSFFDAHQRPSTSPALLDRCRASTSSRSSMMVTPSERADVRRSIREALLRNAKTMDELLEVNQLLECYHP
jgi:hypothetical protein